MTNFVHLVPSYIHVVVCMGNCNNERQQACSGVDGLQYALLLRETISIIKIILDFLVRWHTGNLRHTIVHNDGSLWGGRHNSIKT